MPTFKQPAFVRVDDPHRRKELCEWLEDIGYKFGFGAYDDSYPIVISYAHINKYIYSDIGPSKDVAIDCGTNLLMYREMAALRDDSDVRQWFVSPGGCWCLCSYRSWTDDNLLSAAWHKATPAEIVEHFKD